MPVFISLLRGINVGGNKRIKMADLRTLYQSLGLTNVQSLLQSGNVSFESDLADHGAITAMIEAEIQRAYAFEVRVLLRNAEEFRSSLEKHPFTAAQLQEPTKLLISYLSTMPTDTDIKTLKSGYDGSEDILWRGKELYVFYVNGMARSKLTNLYIERKLGMVSTGRNWNTVTKIVNLLATY
ncbi:MAG: DUF1697 domain-containing protein [Chloroflexi bacterium]|nr:DUF1697 domain-containing protein [Chloroflexota bacterium]